MGLSVKKKLMNTTHFYERPAPELNEPVPWAFPCHKGKPFEDVSHVIWLLWIIGIRKKVMNSPNQCLNTFDWYFPPPEQWTSSAGGVPHEMWPLLASPGEPKDTSPQGNLTWLLCGRELSASSLKDFPEVVILPELCGKLLWEQERGIVDPLRLIFSLSRQDVRFITV